MRSHGVPNFPDPTFLGGRKLVITQPAGVSEDSPELQAALRACQSLVILPGGDPPAFAMSHAPLLSTDRAADGAGGFVCGVVRWVFGLTLLLIT